MIILYLAFAANTARVLTSVTKRDLMPWYFGLHFGFLLLFSIPLWLPGIHYGLRHLYFVLQSAIVVSLLSLDPEIDTVTALFALLSYQAALLFSSLYRWTWVGFFVLLIGGSLVFYHGAIQGLAYGLIPIAVSIVLPAFASANQEIEKVQVASQAMLEELHASNQQLQSYTEQVEELAAIEERDRFARQLHDSVSQTMFSITLHSRSVQMMLESDPGQIKSQLEILHELTQKALAEMRGLIDRLRPTEQ